MSDESPQAGAEFNGSPREPVPQPPYTRDWLAIGLACAAFVAAFLGGLKGCSLPKPPVPPPTPSAAIAFTEAEYTGEPGRFVYLEVVTKGKHVRMEWPVGLDGTLTDKPNQYAVVGNKGTYTVVALTAIDEHVEKGTCTVRFGEQKPPEPGPLPDDPFTRAIQLAYTSDKGTDKAKHKDLLHALYQNAPSTVNQKDITTIVQLYGKLTAARRSLIPDDALLGVRKEIEKSLNASLPTSGTLDDGVRAKVVAEFKRIEKALEAVK